MYQVSFQFEKEKDARQLEDLIRKYRLFIRARDELRVGAAGRAKAEMNRELPPYLEPDEWGEFLERGILYFLGLTTNKERGNKPHGKEEDC